MIGEAGTGKTYAIVAAAEGWAQAGIELRAAAPTWRAANVMRSEGLSATSIASLLGELDRAARAGTEGLAGGSVLPVDEAGMVDSATLARLIAHADDAGRSSSWSAIPSSSARSRLAGCSRRSPSAPSRSISIR